MTVTRKDYQKFASLLKGESDWVNGDTVKDPTFQMGYNAALTAVAAAMVDIFEDDNPRFDAGKFWEACNL